MICGVPVLVCILPACCLLVLSDAVQHGHVLLACFAFPDSLACLHTVATWRSRHRYRRLSYRIKCLGSKCISHMLASLRIHCCYCIFPVNFWRFFFISTDLFGLTWLVVRPGIVWTLASRLRLVWWLVLVSLRYVVDRLLFRPMLLITCCHRGSETSLSETW